MALFFERIEFATPDYDETIRLRYDVLRKPLNLEFTEKQLEEEYDQIHLVLKNLLGKIIACLIFKVQNQDTLKMRQVVVDQSIQSKGVGSILVKESEKWAISNNYKRIELHARDTAIEFYQKLNYKIIGDEFLEVGIPHREMVKKLI